VRIKRVVDQCEAWGSASGLIREPRINFILKKIAESITIDLQAKRTMANKCRICKPESAKYDYENSNQHSDRRAWLYLPQVPWFCHHRGAESGKCPTCEMVKDSIAHSREARTPLERCNTCGGSSTASVLAPTVGRFAGTYPRYQNQAAH